jgi:outer membrane immunogenic protein
MGLFHPRNAVLVALIAGGPAAAADIGATVPVYKAQPAFVSSYNWTGCYIGAEGGGAWGISRQDAANAGADTGQTITGNFGVSGSLIGGTLGCNYQSGNIVWGVENDMSWTNKRGSAFDLAPFDPNTLSETRENWIDTLRGRVGVASDRWFGYLTAGAAFAGTSVNICNTIACVGDSKTRAGWTVGGGAEYALIDNWTLKVEYLYADFGTYRYIDPSVTIPGFTVVSRDVRLNDNIARIGINYKFGGTPLNTRY